LQPEVSAGWFSSFFRLPAARHRIGIDEKCKIQNNGGRQSCKYSFVLKQDGCPSTSKFTGYPYTEELIRQTSNTNFSTFQLSHGFTAETVNSACKILQS
jgi:hypothetical protein